MTGRNDAAWLVDLAGTLTGAGGFLRSPAGHAALEKSCQARGSIAPGFQAGNLIDAVSFTALWLHGKAAPQARQP